MQRVIRAMVVLLLPGTVVQAADITRTVPSGKNQGFDFLASVNPDCSSIGMPTVPLLEKPDYGVVTTDKAKDFRSLKPTCVTNATADE